METEKTNGLFDEIEQSRLNCTSTKVLWRREDYIDYKRINWKIAGKNSMADPLLINHD